MPDFGLLGPLMDQLHQEFVNMYYLMLPVFFGLALVMAWFRTSGHAPDFLDVVKRMVISMLLLVAFPDITKAIAYISEGIAEKVDALNSLDNIVKMAQAKAQSYTMSTTSMILQFNDLLIAILSFLSYLVLYIARYLMVALYHFFWVFFTVISPILLLFNLFKGTSQITVNLFKGMIEVASWKIVWAVLGAMLTAISFGDAFKADGNYVTLIVLNFVIAIAMLMTPMVVHAIAGQGFQGMATTLGTAAVAAMAATPTRAAQSLAMGRDVLNNTGNFMKNNFGMVNRTSPKYVEPAIPMGAPAAQPGLPAPQKQLPAPPPEPTK